MGRTLRWPTWSAPFRQRNDADRDRIGFRMQTVGTTYYLTKLQLQPHETRAINLRKLRDAQQPDPFKSTIPAGATDGSVIWQRADDVPVMGRLVVIERHKAMASNYDCNVCNCPLSFNGGTIILNNGNSATVVAGTTVPLFPLGSFTNPCNYTQYYISVSGSWANTNPSVATVDSSGYVTGLSGGSTTLQITVYGQGCYWNGQGGPSSCQYRQSQGGGGITVNVQQPTTFEALSVTSANLGCDAGTAGTGAQVRYQTLDQASRVINFSGMTPQEHFTVNGTQAFPGFRPFATPQNTDASGQLLDIPVGTCYGPPVPSFNACVDVIQTFNIVVGSRTFPISTITTRRDCLNGIRVQVSPGSSYTIGTVN